MPWSATAARARCSARWPTVARCSWSRRAPTSSTTRGAWPPRAPGSWAATCASCWPTRATRPAPAGSRRRSPPCRPWPRRSARWSVLRHGEAAARRCGHRLQAAVEGARHAQRVRLGQLRPRAREVLVDGLAPEHEPALEVAGAQRHAHVQLGVWAEGAAAVGLRAEQDRLPERRDLRDVRLDVELGDVREDPADDRVGERAAVERAHEALDVVAGLDVGHPY